VKKKELKKIKRKNAVNDNEMILIIVLRKYLYYFKDQIFVIVKICKIIILFIKKVIIRS